LEWVPASLVRVYVARNGTNDPATLTAFTPFVGGSFIQNQEIRRFRFRNNEGAVVTDLGDLVQAGDVIPVGSTVIQPSVRIIKNISDRAEDADFDELMGDRVFVGSNTTLVQPKGLDVDSENGLIIVADLGGRKLVIFDLESTGGNVAPFATVSLASIAGVTGNPWDCDYDESTNRLFVAMTSGQVVVFDNFVGTTTVSSTPSRTFDIGFDNGGGLAKDSVNLHGIDYVPGVDRLILSDVGSAGSTSDGKLYIIDNASTAGAAPATTPALAPAALRIITGTGLRLGNPVDVAFDGSNLYVAEKTGITGDPSSILIYENFLANVNNGPIPPTARIVMDGEGPESVALDSGRRRDFDLDSELLTIPAGQTTTTVDFIVDEDTRDETDETFTVAFSNFVNAIGGATTSATVEIQDDDVESTISVTGTFVTEGTTAVVVVSLDKASGRVITSSISGADGSPRFTSTTPALSPADYTALATTPLTFVEGQTQVAIRINTVDDPLNEAQEVFSVTLAGNPVNALEGTLGADVFVEDTPDDQPLLSVTGPSIVSESAGNLTYTISLQGMGGAPSGQVVTAEVIVEAISPSFTGSDFSFSPNPMSLTFAPGEQTKTVSVSISDDMVNEIDELFRVRLQNISANAQPDVASVDVTITDNDALTVVIANASNGTEGGADVSFSVTLNRASEQSVSFSVSTAGSGAEPAEVADFSSPSSVSFAPGTTSQTVTVSVSDDMVNEAVEQLTTTLALQGTVNGFSAMGSTLSANATIADNDTLTVVIANASNGTEGGADVSFSVTLNRASEQSVSFSVSTAGSGAEPAEVADFSSPSSVSFAPGTTSQTVTVSVSDDMVNEAVEQLTTTLALQGTVNGFSAMGSTLSANATIADNDTLTVVFAKTADGAEPSTNATFSATLNRASEQNVTFTVSAVGSSSAAATFLTDFDLPGTPQIVFAPGATVQPFSVIVNDDTVNEATEGFTATIALQGSVNGFSAMGSTLSASATIADNDLLTVAIVRDTGTPNPVVEGSGANQVFNVTLSRATEQTFTVSYVGEGAGAVQASQNNDYQLPQPQTVSFAGVPGTSVVAPQSISVNIVNDMINEAVEGYNLRLTALSGLTNNVSLAAMPVDGGTINDDDVLTLTVAFVADGSENGAGQSSPVRFSATLNTQSAQTANFSVSTAGSGADGAEAGDFTASTSVSFAPGQVSQSFDVSVVEDAVNEANEGLTVTFALSNTVNLFTPGSSTLSASGSINDDDNVNFVVSSNAGPFMEGNVAGDNRTVGFTVTLSGASEQSPQVTVQTAETVTPAPETGDATRVTDFEEVMITLTFSNPTVSQPVNVNIVEDTQPEQNENLQLMIALVGTPRGVTVATSAATALISDDDNASVTIAAAASPVAEAGSASYTVSLNGPKSSPVTVNFGLNLAGSTANAGLESTQIRGAGNPIVGVYVTQNTGTPNVVGFEDDLSTGVRVSLTPGNNENIVLGRDGRLYMAGDFQAQPSVRIVTNISDRAASPAFDPVRDTIIRGPSTKMVNPKGLEVDVRRGLIFVADFGAQRILVFRTTDSNDVAPAGEVAFGATPWDFDYVAEDDRLFVAATNGTIHIFDNFVATFVKSATNLTPPTSGTARRIIAPAVSGTAVVDNMHGIVYDKATDTLIVSGVGNPTSAPGAIYILRGANGIIGAANDQNVGSVTLNFAHRIVSTTMGQELDNPVDLAFDGVNLYVAEKAKNFVGIYTNILQSFPGNPNQTTDRVPNVVAAASAPESIALDIGRRADFVFNDLSPTVVTFMPGSTSQTVTVPLVNDTRFEGATAETLVGTISSATGPSVLGTSTATVGITDDDTQPTVTVSSFMLAEGNTGTTRFIFGVTFSAASGNPISGTVNTMDGTATVADNDYFAISNFMNTIPEGATFGTIEVMVNGDMTNEQNETFSLQVSAITGASPALVTATGTINNDDGVVIVSIADASPVTEPTTTTALSYTISLSATSGQDVSVTFATTAAGTATGGATGTADFDSVAGQVVTIPAGQTSAMVTVTVNGDGVNETNETVGVMISSPVNATLGTTTASGMINDNDPITVAFNNPNPISVVEGNSGSASLSFNVSLSGPTQQSVSVSVSTNASGTATAGSDFVAINMGSLLNFAPNQTAAPSATLTVSVTGDLINEADQTVGVQLDSVTGFNGVSLGTTTSATGTISDDDALSVILAKTADGAEPGTAATFTATLNTASEQNVSFAVSAAGSGADPAEAGDFSAPMTVTFPAPGMAGATLQTVSVSVTDDSVNEANEGLTVSIAVNGTPRGFVANPGNQMASALINDNDDITVDFVMGTNFSVSEAAGTVPFTLSRSGASEQAVSFNFDIRMGAGTARATAPNQDFNPMVGSVMLNQMTGTGVVNVTVLEDALDENDETFELALSGLSGRGVTFAVSGTTSRSSTLTILDNDALPTVMIDALAGPVAETGSVSFNVSLNPVSGRDVSVTFATTDGTARSTMPRADFTAVNSVVMIPAGSTSAQISVTIFDDSAAPLNEATETFMVGLSGPDNAVIGGTPQTVMITDNDALIVSINNPSVTEVNSGSTSLAPFLVTTNVPTEQLVTVSATSADETALERWRRYG
jgi:hypothetical protein